MGWINTAASISLEREFDAAFPERDKASDGTLGDASHNAGPSDHNRDESQRVESESDLDNIDEVHARDVTSNLRRPGWSMEKVVQLILARCRIGAETRLRYIIYNKRIWSRNDGWVERWYGDWSSGRNPHDHHAHFSFRYGSGSGKSNPENNTSAWGILAAVNSEDDMDPADLGGAIAQKHLTKAIRDARAQTQALELGRLKERGWGGDKGMSERQLQEYIFEQVVGPAKVDADGDGKALESAGLQARLARLEEGQARIEAALNKLAGNTTQSTPKPETPAAVKK